MRIATLPPASWVSSGSPATGWTSSEEPMQSSTSARSQSSRARSSVGAGEQLAEQHDVGLQRRAAALAARHAVAVAAARRARTSSSATRPPQARHEQLAMLPCTSTSSRVPARRWSMSMFWVITAVEQPALLQRHERAVRAVGLLGAERGEALAVEAPEAHGIAAERVDVRDLHRVDPLPQPGPGRAEVGDARGHRDARAGQRDDRARVAHELGQALALGGRAGARARTCVDDAHARVSFP